MYHLMLREAGLTYFRDMDSCTTSVVHEYLFYSQDDVPQSALPGLLRSRDLTSSFCLIVRGSHSKCVVTFSLS